MRLFPFAAGLLFLVTLAYCGGGNPPPLIGLTNGTALPQRTGSNVLTMTVAGSQCSQSNLYPNKPCVTVQICTPGTSTCQTINDILLDTGSSGLRIFRSLLTIAPTQSTISGNALAECQQYADGTSDWGPVMTAGVILGGEAAVQVPIQAIDASYVGANTNCPGSDTTPAEAGFNGLLGVGIFAQDCGASCADLANNQVYFACNGTSCTSTAVPLAQQVLNPVAQLPKDNNGVILELPSIALGGTASVNGYVILGIGTQANNTPPAVNFFAADSGSGEFSSTFSGTSVSGFIDSGSNAYYFPGPTSLPDCGATHAGYSGLYCPSAATAFSAVMTGNVATQLGTIDFSVGNFFSLATSADNAFLELGGSSSNYFDWGLPFHFGRNVYVGIEGTSSPLGTGPYWAF